MPRRLAAFAAALAVAPVLGASAVARADGPALLSLGVGAFDVVLQDDVAADFRLEYRHDEGLWIIRPWIGLEATSDGALYGLVGLLADVPLGERLVLTPSAGVGAYRDGDGKDLGHTVEFRTQLELAYRFDNQARLGVAFSHISNANLGDRNPGAEIVTLYYSHPLGALFGE